MSQTLFFTVNALHLTKPAEPCVSVYFGLPPMETVAACADLILFICFIHQNKGTLYQSSAQQNI